MFARSLLSNFFVPFLLKSTLFFSLEIFLKVDLGFV